MAADLAVEGVVGVPAATIDLAQQVERLAMVNPIGLEDWKALGVPYRTVDQWYARELKLDAEGVRAYERKTYYAGRWKPEFDRWVDMLAGLNKGPGHAQVAWNSALIYDMIFSQPVYYEFQNLKMPTLLLIGTSDTTAIGSDIMVAASEGYALMKLFGKAEGLSELQQAMRVRRPGRRRKGDAAAG